MSTPPRLDATRPGSVAHYVDQASGSRDGVLTAEDLATFADSYGHLHEWRVPIRNLALQLGAMTVETAQGIRVMRAGANVALGGLSITVRANVSVQVSVGTAAALQPPPRRAPPPPPPRAPAAPPPRGSAPSSPSAAPRAGGGANVRMAVPPPQAPSTREDRAPQFVLKRPADPKRRT